MRPHPHQQWASKYTTPPPPRNTTHQPAPQRMPKTVARKFYLEANRLYARTSTLFIRKVHLPSQSHLNDKQTRLQDHLNAERETRGNGSPICENPQQVFTFSATDQVPGNTVLDDGFFDEVVPGAGGKLDMLPAPWTTRMMVNEDLLHQRMVRVDREHRSMVQSLVGPPLPSDVDVRALVQMERSLSAQGF